MELGTKFTKWNLVMYKLSILCYNIHMAIGTTTRINAESQKMLAKLLAKENVTVQIGNYKTAFFDVQNRILGLPTWNTDSKHVSDLLIGHEVGHALYTPVDSVEQFRAKCPGVPFCVANIVEDIRIERMVQSNYPGLVYSFKEGYKNFIEKDFFEIGKTSLMARNFADRLNIHAKAGGFVKVPLSKNEKAIYDRCLAAQTFDEVLVICNDIYAMIKDELEKEAEEKEAEEKKPSKSKQKPNEDPTLGNGFESDESDGNGDDEDDGKPSGKEGEDCDSTKSKPSDDDDDDDDATALGENEDSTEGTDSSDTNAPTGNTSGGNIEKEWKPDYSSQDQFESKTADALSQNLDSLKENIIDYNVGNVPTHAEMMEVVIPVHKVMAERKVKEIRYANIMSDPAALNDWKAFRVSTKKHLAVLVKEFERRKAAFQYSRAQQSTTGTIDANRLYSYKFDDKIFKSVMNLADAKNHGMMFFIDYSGSMRGSIQRVLNQTLQLVFFCKAVGIPFSVYGFSSPSGGRNYDNTTPQAPGHNISFAGTNIFELINSTMKKADFDLAARELKAQSFKFSHSGNGDMPFGGKYEYMYLTPLIETIIIAHELVKQFRAKHNVQKMNTIFLTDGDACSMPISRNDAHIEHMNALSTSIYSTPTKVRINGGKYVTIPSGSQWGVQQRNALYAALIENLKVTCDTTVIGFFIANRTSDYNTSGINAIRHSDKNGVVGNWGEASDIFQIKKKAAKKERCMVIKNGFRYDAYFVFDGSKSLDDASDMDFDSDVESEDGNFAETTSQNKLAKDFTKFNAEKKISRVFLNKFVEIIA